MNIAGIYLFFISSLFFFLVWVWDAVGERVEELRFRYLSRMSLLPPLAGFWSEELLYNEEELAFFFFKLLHKFVISCWVSQGFPNITCSYDWENVGICLNPWMAYWKYSCILSNLMRIILSIRLLTAREVKYSAFVWYCYREISLSST